MDGLDFSPLKRWIAPLLLTVAAADLWVLAGYLPDELDLALALHLVGQGVLHGLGVLCVLAVVWGAACVGLWGDPRRRAQIIKAAVLSVAFVGWAFLIHRIVVTRHWSLPFLHGIAAVAFVAVTLFNLTWRGATQRRAQWLWRLSLVALLVFALTVVAFGTTSFHVTPKYLKDPVLTILLYCTFLYFVAFCWATPTISRRLAARAGVIGLVGYMACLAAVPLLSQKSTFAVARTTEGARAFRALNRHLATSLGVGGVPWLGHLVGKDQTPPSRAVPEHEGVGCERHGDASARSVVLISIDALRADFYGSSLEDLPSLNRLRHQGIDFTRAMQATSGTAGSVFALHTGRYIQDETPVRDAWKLVARDLGHEQALLMQPEGASAGEFTSTIIRKIRRHRESGAPFLLHAHYLSLHLPAGMQRRGWDYSAILREVDTELGRLLEYLDEAHAWEDTVFILTADHGEELREERGYVSHGYGVTQTLIHVPLMVVSPDASPTTVRSLVSAVDVFPTMLEALGIRCGYPMHGHSLLDEPRPGRLAYASSMAPTPALGSATPLLYSDIHAVLHWPWKLVFNRGENAWALYNLEKDPHERRNVVDEQEDVRRQLQPSLLRYVRGRPPKAHLDATGAPHQVARTSGQSP
jgi:hypothetical protein